MKTIAKHLIDNNFKVVPLLKQGDGKKAYLKQWEDIAFEASEFNDKNNIGINIGLSKLVDVDLENEIASYFGGHLLINNTYVLGVKLSEHNIRATHYLYDNSDNNISEKTEWLNEDGSCIIELRINGQTVAPPSIASTKLLNGQKAERVWIANSTKAKDDNLLFKCHKIAFATKMSEFLRKRNSENMPIVKLATCLKRYTDWSYDDRVNFIKLICSRLDEKFQSNDVETKHIKPVEKNWDKKDKPMSGYLSLATDLKVDQHYLKTMFNWIGSVPEDTRKTIVDFRAKSMTLEDYSKKVEYTYLVEKMVPDVGLGILAGRPKSMKSFLAIDLAFKIYNADRKSDAPNPNQLDGVEFLGNKVSEQGDVLGLFLEDTKNSFALRTQSMFLTNWNKPCIFTEEQCPSIGRGLEESIDMWVESSNKPKLVIIDPFQKIKPMYAPKNANAYEVDYMYLTKLRDIAIKNKIFILYIHHLAQADRSYSWDKIMGSTGHQGVVDAMYMLERDEVGDKGTISGRGRNIEDFKYDLIWNEDKDYHFNCKGDSVKRHYTSSKQMVLLAMKQLFMDDKPSVRPNEVLKILNLVGSSKEGKNISRTMTRMRDAGDLCHGNNYGEYKLTMHVSNIDKDGNLI